MAVGMLYTQYQASSGLRGGHRDSSSPLLSKLLFYNVWVYIWGLIVAVF